jgi:glycosyltransferase involved in cell wall biosynthesis
MLVDAKMIVVPSYYFKNVLMQTVPAITSTNIFVSPSGGVDTDKFNINGKKKNKPNIFTVGYVSRIDKGKGWQVFLNAIKMLKNNKENIRVLVAGSGKEETEFIKKVYEYGLYDLIEYQGGLTQEKLVTLYPEMDIFIFSTELRESLGLVGIEAMACGVPVIGSKTGGLTDYIVDGFNGFFFEPGNTVELVEKIEFYMKLPSIEKEQMKLYARKTAESYNSYIVAEKLHNKLMTILNEN